MVAVIRVLIVLSVFLLLVALLLPFQSPLSVAIQLHQPPAKWLFGTFVLLAGLVAGAVASAGLMLFRRWGRLLATAASAQVALAAWLLAHSPVASQVSDLGVALFAAGALAWLCGVALSYHPLVAPRFRA